MDVWAVALICLELVLPKPLLLLLSGSGETGAANAAPVGGPHPFYVALSKLTSPPRLPPGVAEFGSDGMLLGLMRGMLQPDPARRLTAAQALEHPFFTSAPPLSSPPRPLDSNGFDFGSRKSNGPKEGAPNAAGAQEAVGTVVPCQASSPLDTPQQPQPAELLPRKRQPEQGPVGPDRGVTSSHQPALRRPAVTAEATTVSLPPHKSPPGPAAASGASDGELDAAAEVSSLKLEVQQLHTERASHERELQSIRSRLLMQTASSESSPASSHGQSQQQQPPQQQPPSPAQAKAAEAQLIADMRRTNEVLEEARRRTEGALSELAEVQRRNAALSEEQTDLLRRDALPEDELHARTESAEKASATAERLLAATRETLADRRDKLEASQERLRKSELQLSAGERLDAKLGASGGRGASETSAQTYAQADKRVREVQQLAKEQLREERRRSNDGMSRAQRSARKVQDGLRRQLEEAQQLAQLQKERAPDRALRTANRQHQPESGAPLGGTPRVGSPSKHTLELQREAFELRSAIESSQSAKLRLGAEARLAEEALLGTQEAVQRGLSTERDVAATLRHDNELLVGELERMQSELEHTHSVARGAEMEAERIYGEGSPEVEEALKSARLDVREAKGLAQRAEERLDRLAVTGGGGGGGGRGLEKELRRELRRAVGEIEELEEELESSSRRRARGGGGGGGGRTVTWGGANATTHLFEARHELERVSHELRLAHDARVDAERRAQGAYDDASHGGRRAIAETAFLDDLRYDLKQAKQQLADETRRCEQSERELRGKASASKSGGAAEGSVAEDLRQARMRNAALREDLRKMDAERERQLRDLAERKDAALLKMRTALLASEEGRGGEVATRRVEVPLPPGHAMVRATPLGRPGGAPPVYDAARMTRHGAC